jgi:hypothetical protein
VVGAILCATGTGDRTGDEDLSTDLQRHSDLPVVGLMVV